MMLMIGDTQLASLYAGLEVPVAVADLLDRAAPLSDDDILALTAHISELSAERALLALAGCADIISSHAGVSGTIQAPLRLQADFVLNDYAPHALRPSDADLEGQSVYMQEDFEAFADIFLISAEAAQVEFPALCTICRILADQAQAFGEMLGQEPLPYDFSTVVSPVVLPSHSGNVIVFPLSRRTLA